MLNFWLKPSFTLSFNPFTLTFKHHICFISLPNYESPSFTPIHLHSPSVCIRSPSFHPIFTLTIRQPKCLISGLNHHSPSVLTHSPSLLSIIYASFRYQIMNHPHSPPFTFIHPQFLYVHPHFTLIQSETQISHAHSERYK